MSESVSLISLRELIYILGYFYFSQVQVTDEVREYLRKPTFDNWQWDDPEMIILLRQMYIDLGLVSRFNIEVNHSLFLLRQLSDTCMYDSRYFLHFEISCKCRRILKEYVEIHVHVYSSLCPVPDSCHQDLSIF